MSEPDALIGLRFEVGGGLGRMTGRVLGKAGHLYLVQKTDADFLELLELDDLRSAKFFADAPAMTTVTTGTLSPLPADAPAPASLAQEATPKRKLSDQLRRRLSGRVG